MFKWTLVRLVFLFVVLMAVDVACQVAPQFLHLPWLLPKSGAFAMARGLGLGLAMIIAYRLLVRWTEGRKADELGQRGAVSLTLLGIVLGGAMFALVFALLAYRNLAHLGAFLGTDGVWIAVGGAIADAVGEEIVIRGVVFRLLEESFGTLIGLFVSGALFGLLHSFNHGASVLSDVAIALEAGIFLAAGYAATRSLWFPIGLHFGWNFTEGGVFGAAVSGGAHQGLYASTFTGDALWSGGAFGPEASVIAVGVSLVASAVFLGIAIARGNWVGVRFRMRSGE